LPTIKIKTDRFTPNYCALEAVGIWMLENYTERNHLTVREITVKSGRTLRVRELADKKGMSVCSCSFSVTRVAQ
jgi:hypothetical protein